MSIDPRFTQYPYMSSYCFAANNPIKFIDIKGEGPGEPIKTDRANINSINFRNVDIAIPFPTAGYRSDYGEFYYVAAVLAMDRQYKEFTQKFYKNGLVIASGPYGTAYSFASAVYDEYSSPTAESGQGLAIETGQIIFEESAEASGKFGKAVPFLTAVAVVYDFSQIGSRTKEEALKELSFNAAEQIYGGQFIPSAGEGPTNLKLSKDDFESPEQAAIAMNLIFHYVSNLTNQLDLDLSNDDDFQVAKDIINHTTITSQWFDEIDDYLFNYQSEKINTQQKSNSESKPSSMPRFK